MFRIPNVVGRGVFLKDGRYTGKLADKAMLGRVAPVTC